MTSTLKATSWKWQGKSGGQLHDLRGGGPECACILRLYCQSPCACMPLINSRQVLQVGAVYMPNFTVYVFPVARPTNGVDDCSVCNCGQCSRTPAGEHQNVVPPVQPRTRMNLCSGRLERQCGHHALVHHACSLKRKHMCSSALAHALSSPETV